MHQIFNSQLVLDETNRINRVLADFLQIDVSPYENQWFLHILLSKLNAIPNDGIVYLCNNSIFTKAVNLYPNGWDFGFCPDCIVYGGYKMLKLNDEDKQSLNITISEYIKDYGVPTVILFKNHVYVISENISKAREIESVMAFGAKVLLANKEEEITTLSMQERSRLLNWDAEKYRRSLIK